ncbi:EAL domain-containing protein [Sphingomonas sp. H39-1-10]|uniref:EAL domain-containing protein n=1 Tax=Sphingomonas pollutisoli TaxID=3030829 RepID=UPI0023B9178E|nr:EAL domain-containing protein [Sphingomonas pollutisoli]MDF0488703.1 EAL domain-containing protein [Sphingomonas pollutisoli]
MARALQIQHVFGASPVPRGGLLSERGEARSFGSATGDAAGGSYQRPSSKREDIPAATLPWQMIVLAEITNFAGLRRHLGRPRADRLIFDLIGRASDCVPGIRSVGAGRTIAELELGAIDLAAIEATVEALSAAFDTPFDLDGELHRVDIVLAAAAAPAGSTEDVRLVEEAEGALEQARIELRPIVRDLSAGTPAFDRLSLVRELPAAIANGEMFLQYQPKVHVRRQAISSAEALIRWQHPRRGLILPGDFITIAEEARQISALTLWTLDQVIADQKTLCGDGRDLTIFINISGQLLGDAEFVAEACRKVGAAGVRIGFEITETAVIRDPQSAIANLCRFDDVGITIAIDDYGAGLSSLAYLKQLPARELKIDKMFILQLTSSNRDPLIVRSTIDLAHALEMEVTAEGVETQAALALLSVMGCDMVQGYLISRPVSIEAFRQFLRDDNLQLGGDLREAMFKRPASFWRTG